MSMAPEEMQRLDSELHAIQERFNAAVDEYCELAKDGYVMPLIHNLSMAVILNSGEGETFSHIRDYLMFAEQDGCHHVGAELDGLATFFFMLGRRADGIDVSTVPGVEI
jgi:hypothetical protein